MKEEIINKALERFDKFRAKSGIATHPADIREFIKEELLTALNEQKETTRKEIGEKRKPILGKDQFGTELYKMGTGDMYFNEGVDQALQVSSLR